MPARARNISRHKWLTEPVPGDAWTDFLPESAKLDADWPGKDCGMFNTQTNACVQVQSNY